MTLTKAHKANSIRSLTGYTEDKSFEILETLLEIIKKFLTSGDDVFISGFGKFSVKSKNERRGRNPDTGRSMMLKVRKVVTFKWSGKLRNKINGS
jgi:integration host factor subunit alpha